MKSISKLIVSLLLVFGTISCVDQDFDTPPTAPIIDVDVNSSISELIALYKGETLEITEDLNIEGYVISDDTEGNYYMALAIQDSPEAPTSGIEVRINRSNLTNDYKVGDKIIIKCKGLHLGDYGTMIQLGSIFEEDGEPKFGRIAEAMIPDHIFKTADNIEITPKTVQIAELTPAMVNTLVKLENVQFIDSELEESYGDPDKENKSATNRTLQDKNGNTIIVRTSDYAKFAGETINPKSGAITAVLTKFKETYQLMLRDLNDVAFDNDRFNIVAQPVESINETFESITNNAAVSIAGWLNISVKGTRVWNGKTFDTDKYTQATSYNAKDEELTDGELVSWLITPPVIMTDSKVLTLKTAKSNWNHTNSPFRVMASTDFSGVASEIENANWDELSGTFAAEGDADHAWIESGNIDLATYAGKNVYIAFVYNGTKTETSSYRIDDIQVGEAQAPPAGEGTKDKPFSTTEAIANNTGSGLWVKGFIVGVMETDGSENTPNYEGNFQTNSNLLLAASADEKNLANVLTVQLPSGDIRTALNLVDNAGNHKKEVILRGNLTAYFGQPGLKSTNGYWMDGAGIDPDAEKEGALFYERFETDGSLGSFTAFAVNANGTKGWYQSTYGSNSFAKVSSYNDGAIESEHWLVSTAIDLTGKNKPYFKVNQAVNKMNDPWSLLKVLVSSDYDGSSSPAENGTWTELTINTKPAGDSWAFVDSENIDLSAYVGKKIHIAFKYQSTTDVAATWEVGRVMIKEDK